MKSINNEYFYRHTFKESIFVLKIGGKLLQDGALSKLLQSILYMVHNDIRIVLVHGGGIQADQLSEKLGHTPKKIDGRRITTAEDLEIAKMAMAGQAHANLLQAFKKNGLMALSFNPIATDLFEIELRPKEPIDFGYVGDIKSVNPRLIFDVIPLVNLLVVPPIAATADGTVVNINADTVATNIAVATKAKKLIFLLEVDGLLCGDKVISVLSEKDIKELLPTPQVFGGMKVKLENCIAAIEGGVPRVHLLNGFSEGALVNEIFTSTGKGTMILSESEKDNYLNEVEYL